MKVFVIYSFLTFSWVFQSHIQLQGEIYYIFFVGDVISHS